MLASIAVMAGAAISGAAKAKPVDGACNSASPSAALCIGADKLAEAGAATCRRTPAPNDACATLPLGHDVVTSELAAYQASWVHRATAFQYALGSSVPLRDALFLGTHNSFNADANGVTASHTDNNQQLTLAQQLDGDIRALELDVHFVAGTEHGGAKVVRVCHGRGADQQHLGCTTEPLLSAVLPELETWLAAHPDQVLLLYLEDNLGDPTGYAETVDALDQGLIDASGGSLIYRPDPKDIATGGCANLPLGVSRDDVRTAHRNVVLVGNCANGWAADVFGWDANHVEGGSTPGYQPFPACDSSYDRPTYEAKFVRYYEDSTWLSAAIDPSQSPAAHEADSLTPPRVTAMVDCGVNLFGFDQFDPNDGRIAASIFSWAPGQPDASAGACALQRADGRWVTGDCTAAQPAACRTAAGSWTLSAPVDFAGARAACSATDGTFAVPRTGLQNAQLRQAAADSGGLTWIDQRS